MTLCKLKFKHICEGEYRDKLNLVNIMILNKSDIGISAFENCRNIQNVILDVKNINKYAFKNCRSIYNCKFDNVLTISESAFENCINIGELRLNSNLISIGKNAFRGCQPTMILCSKSIFNRYLSNRYHQLDMRYLFGNMPDITSYYKVSDLMAKFYSDYDIAIIKINPI